MRKKKIGEMLPKCWWEFLWKQDKSIVNSGYWMDMYISLYISIYRQYNVDYKLETYLKIARLYLEDDDPVQAEAYINRASLLQNESTNEQLQIHYKVCYARVLDYRRKFIEAAQRYNELSYKTIVHESERLEALKHALHCTILASAGQQRSRMLATLFQGERGQQPAAHGILEKMYLGVVIRGNQLQAFAAMLMPHQKATTADGRKDSIANDNRGTNEWIY
ncbi:COP9 signalosome subunit 4 [Phyllostomus discolor]|uniref:COP9 signalosome subunit 4 n=1 Tax=Phyllostomus discolor TaxID=89673 RepID=A0A834BI68_9CHIR|nr:COP9 signalosome subunit 4 [Phyllostomus discolor]